MYKYILLILLIYGCSNTSVNRNGIESEGTLQLKLQNKVTYLLPSTFQFNSPFSQIFYDKKSKKEYITFGNDYAYDSLYFFDLEKGGLPVQVTSFSASSRDVKGVHVISLDSIIVVPRGKYTIDLINGKGEVTSSKSFKKLIANPHFKLQVTSQIGYVPSSQTAFFRIEISDWDFNEKSRLIAMKKFNNIQSKSPFILSVSNIFSDSLKIDFFGSNFFKRFVDSNYAYFVWPSFLVKDSNLLITSAYSDSIYRLNHYSETKNRYSPVLIKSSFYDTLKSKLASLETMEDANSMDFLNNRGKNNSIQIRDYFKKENWFLISITSKAIEFDATGKAEKYEQHTGMIVCDENLNKIGEFKLTGKGLFKSCKSGVLVKIRLNKNDPNYDPRKIEMEIYTLSK